MDSDDEMDLIDEIAAQAANRIVEELKQRGFFARTTPRYEDELEAEIAAIIGTELDENLELIEESE